MPSALGAERFHGVMSITWLAAGDAARIASTPLSIVIAVTAPLESF
jgi:hypothetical protein